MRRAAPAKRGTSARPRSPRGPSSSTGPSSSRGPSASTEPSASTGPSASTEPTARTRPRWPSTAAGRRAGRRRGRHDRPVRRTRGPRRHPAARRLGARRAPAPAAALVRGAAALPAPPPTLALPAGALPGPRRRSRPARVDVLRGGALAELPHGAQSRREPVPALRRMLDDAGSALAAARAAGDPAAQATVDFGVTSAYRSALQQYRLWNGRFPRYFAQTARERASQPGGATGEAAARWLAHWIGRWLGAPGFSNHNDGRAVDLMCRLTSGRRLAANRSDIPAWRSTWLHRWLTEHAAAYGFVPYLPEPWQWEYRPDSVGVVTHGGAARRARAPR